MTWGWACAAAFLLAARSQADTAVCAPCHKAEVAHFAESRMTRALEKPADNAKLTAMIGPYSYRISGIQYEVTDGAQSFRTPLAWAFGQGSAGQTYLYEKDGTWYESRVSFFSALNGLDLTMGAQNITPHSVPEGAGRSLSKSETSECFGCHATGKGSAMVPGVQCDRCHGESGDHLKAVGAGRRKLGSLSTEEMSDLCGQCHRTWSQIAASGPRGIQNVRFQPYRLTNSKCYDAADLRIRCTACHDPHGRLETSASAYDAKCLSCHATNHICPKGTKDCVTCHMPQLELPGAHKKFTDHMIRIVRANDKYPD
jgi:Cytochrome c554 and c-prime